MVPFRNKLMCIIVLVSLVAAIFFGSFIFMLKRKHNNRFKALVDGTEDAKLDCMRELMRESSTHEIERALPFLIVVVQKNNETMAARVVAMECINELGINAPPESILAIENTLDSADDHVRYFACRSLTRLNARSPKSMSCLIHIIENNKELRPSAIYELSFYGFDARPAMPLIQKLLTGDSVDDRRAATSIWPFLVTFEHEIVPLIRQLEDEDHNVQGRAIDGLGKLEGLASQYLSNLERFAESDNRQLAKATAVTIGAIYGDIDQSELMLSKIYRKHMKDDDIVRSVDASLRTIRSIKRADIERRVQQR